MRLSNLSRLSLLVGCMIIMGGVVNGQSALLSNVAKDKKFHQEIVSGTLIFDYMIKDNPEEEFLIWKDSTDHIYFSMKEVPSPELILELEKELPELTRKITRNDAIKCTLCFGKITENGDGLKEGARFLQVLNSLNCHIASFELLR